ncbi:MAG: EAL domain-containing protein [Betaproteobacteria bacterium]
MRVRPRSVAVELALLVAIVAVPLAGLAALLLYESAQREKKHASDVVRHMAVSTAEHASTYVAAVRTTLEVIATRPGVRAMDPNDCDPGLPDLLKFYPHSENILVVDLEGRILCGAIPPPRDRVVRIADDALLKDMIADPRLRLSKPVVGRVNKRWVVSAVQPVFGADGRLAGTVSMAIDLLTWIPFPAIVGAQQNTAVAVLTNDGIVIARSSEPEKWIGRDASSGEIHRHAANVKDGMLTARGVEGIERVWAFTPVPGADWYAIAGLPAEQVFEPVRVGIIESVALLMVGLAAAISMAFSLARILVRRVGSELRSSEAKFSVVVQHSWDAFQLLGPDRRILYVSPSVTRILGYQPEDQIGRISADFVHPEDIERTAGFMRQLLASAGASVSTQVRVRHKDGSWRWVESSATNLLDHPDVRAIAVNYRDITDRKVQQEKIERLNRVYSVLSGINAAIVRIRDRDELFAEACRIAVADGRMRSAWIGVVDRETNEVKVVAWHGGDAQFVESLRGRTSMRIDAAGDTGIVAHAVSGRTAVVSNDVANDARVTLKVDLKALGVRSLAVLPMVLNGETAAVLMLHAAELGYFDADEMKLLLELAGDIAFAMNHIRELEKLDYLAYYDSLTGLANRTLFIEHLGQYLHTAGQAGEKVGLVVADVERMRNVNDSLGRQAGDALLKALAARLSLGADRTELARISADQFAILLLGVKGRSAVTRRFEHMWQDCFGAPYTVDGTELRIAAKAGIALFPSDGMDAETLVRNAEAALRQAKKTGERHVFHAAAMTEHTAEKLTLENRLRRALEKGEFVLHYQPKVNLESRRLMGVEALIRWQSPELGLVPPGQFIALMEETGMILEAGAWAISQAVRDHARWLELGLPAPRVAVNVSAVQLRKKDYLATLSKALQRGAAPTGIDLEITESLVMDDIQGNIEKLKEARKLGVSIAIDDFGTGYSSLGYLARLPVQALKIDRSFIITMLNEPDTMTLVSTIISLAHSLKLKVIAEGVETEDQATMLRLLRCDEMQGYLYSRPVPFDEISGLLRTG